MYNNLWKIQAKNSKNENFDQKGIYIKEMDPFLTISEFYRHIEYDYHKEDQKLSKLSIVAKKWPNFGHLRIFPAYTL